MRPKVPIYRKLWGPDLTYQRGRVKMTAGSARYNFEPLQNKAHADRTIGRRPRETTADRRKMTVATW